MPPERLPGAALVMTVLAVGCGGDPSPTAPTAARTPTTALMACPANIARQSIDALPVAVSWDPPTVAGLPVDKGSCAPVSGTEFPIGSSSVTCTADQPALATACSFSVTITPPDASLRSTHFMAFGDSITEGVVNDALRVPAGTSPVGILALLRAARGRTIPGISTAIQPFSAYPTQLQTLLASAFPTLPIRVTNAGISGERAAQGVSRIMGALQSAQPDVLLLLEGINDIDLLALLDQIGPQTGVLDVSPIAADLRSMVLTAQGLGVEVLLATLTPVTFEEEASPGARAAILNLNAEIRLMAIELGLGGAVDLYATLDGVPGIIGPDTLHPTATGYRRMAEIFFAEIVSRYDNTPRPPALTAVR